jgi:protein-S-isoprenylcysteine O-methyltransferase Ste14
LIDRIIIFLWAAFAAIWLAASFMTKPAERREPLAGRLGYGALLALGGAMAFGMLDALFPGRMPAPPPAASEAVVACGLALAIWARITIGSNWSGTVDLKKGHSLVTHGPYSLVRHPIYTAVLLMLLGTAMSDAAPGAFLGMVPASLSMLIKMGREEELMARRFPGEYGRYRKRVKALVPFVW